MNRISAWSFLVRRPFQNLGNQQTGRGYRSNPRGSTKIKVKKSTYYCDGNVFGIICDATKYMEEARLQYGYKHYRGNIIEGVKK